MKVGQHDALASVAVLLLECQSPGQSPPSSLHPIDSLFSGPKVSIFPWTQRDLANNSGLFPLSSGLFLLSTPVVLHSRGEHDFSSAHVAALLNHPLV